MTAATIALPIAQVRPGIFQIATPDFVATVDAEAYVPDVIVRYAAGIGERNACNPVYSRDHDFRGTGITMTVVNANPGHMAVQGEVAAVNALLDAADVYMRQSRCRTCYSRCPLCGHHANILVGVCAVCDGE